MTLVRAGSPACDIMADLLIWVKSIALGGRSANLTCQALCSRSVRDLDRTDRSADTKTHVLRGDSLVLGFLQSILGADESLRHTELNSTEQSEAKLKQRVGSVESRAGPISWIEPCSLVATSLPEESSRTLP
jgi:hypothetical protein